jgi:hypothetical protein
MQGCGGEWGKPTGPQSHPQVPMANTPSYTSIADGMIADLGRIDLDGGTQPTTQKAPPAPPPRHRKSETPTPRKRPTPPSLPEVQHPRPGAWSGEKGEGKQSPKGSEGNVSHTHTHPHLCTTNHSRSLEGGRVLWYVGAVKEPGYISQI